MELMRKKCITSEKKNHEKNCLVDYRLHNCSFCTTHKMANTMFGKIITIIAFMIAIHAGVSMNYCTLPNIFNCTDRKYLQDAYSEQNYTPWEVSKR